MNKIIKVPDGWEDINIRTFQELKAVEDNDNKLFETVAILTNEDPEDIKKWDVASFNRVSSALDWTLKLPSNELKKTIEIDGVKYGFVDRLSSLNLGNWWDIEHYLQDPIGNIHFLMAIFYRPILFEKGDKYVTEEYESVTGMERAEMFREKMNISDCYGSLLFFSTIAKDSIQSIQGYFLKEIRLKTKHQKKRRFGLRRIRSWLSGRGSTMLTN